MLNVVLNGVVQAMPNGGKLTVSARREDDLVVTEIQDEGGGPLKPKKIFELYFTTKKDGTGIGLAQTYQILQWHYGSVDFESKEGQAQLSPAPAPDPDAVRFSQGTDSWLVEMPEVAQF
jgi:signal transduction histidine kinase